MLFSLYNRELAKREALLTDNYCPNCLALLTAPSSLTGRIQIIAACQSNGGHLNILWEKFACNTREEEDLNTPAERQHWQAGLSRVQTPVEQHQEMAGGFLNGSRYTQASKVRRVAPAFCIQSTFCVSAIFYSVNTLLLIINDMHHACISPGLQSALRFSKAAAQKRGGHEGAGYQSNSAWLFRQPALTDWRQTDLGPVLISVSMCAVLVEGRIDVSVKPTREPARI